MRRSALAAMSNSIPNRFEINSGGSTAGAADTELSTLAPATPLANALGERFSQRLGEYRGARTPEVFSSAPDELAALLTAAGAYDLGWRCFLRCTGEDRLRWLNGMVTSFVTGLEENTGCYGFVLNAQGRIQGDLDIYRRADALWLETDHAQIAALTAFLDHYIIMDDVALEPQPGWTAIGISGPLAAEKIAAAGLPVASSPRHLVEASWQGHPIVGVAAHSPLVARYEIWIEQESALDVWGALNAVGATPCGSISIEQLRILEGTPAYSVDITNKDLPQETNQTRALHFTKGCYLGQEIVERVRSRGNVHRTLSGFVLEDARPTAKTSLLADGKPVGEITSVVRVSLQGIGEKVVALGTIRREALERNATLTANETSVSPSRLPFDFVNNAVQP